VEIIFASSQDIMFSSFQARFEAVAASLTASFPPAKINFTGDTPQLRKLLTSYRMRLLLPSSTMTRSLTIVTS
jgi:hypothetical protein